METLVGLIDFILFFFSGLKLKTIILNGTIPIGKVKMCRVKTFINSGGLLFLLVPFNYLSRTEYWD
jgi:hypothetical protein